MSGNFEKFVLNKGSACFEMVALEECSSLIADKTEVNAGFPKPVTLFQSVPMTLSRKIALN